MFMSKGKDMLKHRLITVLLAGIIAAMPVMGLRAAVPSTTVSYLQSKDRSDAWIAMGLRAAGHPVNPDSISTAYLSSATDIERAILGVVAANGNPYSHTSLDLVSLLDAKRSGGQIGETQLLNDDVFGLLAYKAAGYASDDSRIIEARSYLLSQQNSDGGFGYSVSAASDSNMTAMAVMALLKTGSRASDTAIQSSLSYMRGLQQNDGGFPISHEFTSDSASTAWVMSALYAAGLSPVHWSKNGKTGFDFLTSASRNDGSYAWKPTDVNGSAVITAYVAVALAGASYPVATFARPAPVLIPAPAPTPAPVFVPQPSSGLAQEPIPSSSFVPHVRFRIEGDKQQVCQGETEALTAYQVVEAAAVQCGFTYQVDWTSAGPYVKRIHEDSALGDQGWLYRVNWQQPSVSADQWNLRDNDYVTWYYGRFDEKNLKLTVVGTQEIPTGQRVFVLAEGGMHGSMAPAAHVSLYVNQFRYETDANGMAVFTMPPGWISLRGVLNDHVPTHVVRHYVE